MRVAAQLLMLAAALAAVACSPHERRPDSAAPTDTAVTVPPVVVDTPPADSLHVVAPRDSTNCQHTADGGERCRTPVTPIARPPGS